MPARRSTTKKTPTKKAPKRAAKPKAKPVGKAPAEPRPNTRPAAKVSPEPPVEAKPAPKEPAEPLTIEETVEVEAPPGRAWTAITSPDEINRWFTWRCEFEARVGGRILYWWSSKDPGAPVYVTPSRFGTAAEVRIEAWNPPQTFSARAVAHWPGTVTFRVESTPRGCRVSVEHAGFPKRDDWFRMHKEGWKKHLDLLRNYLEKPEAEYEAYLIKKQGG